MMNRACVALAKHQRATHLSSLFHQHRYGCRALHQTATITEFSKKSGYYESHFTSRAVAAATAAAVLGLLQSDTGRNNAAACRAAQVLPPSTGLNSDYRSFIQHGSVLGAGYNASVYLGQDTRTGENVAVKVLSRSLSSDAAVQDEASILSEAHHDNIISLRGLFSDQSYHYMVMELAQGGELFERLIRKGMLTEQQAVSVMRQVLEAVAWLHAKKVVHADLKPENLLITADTEDELVVKIADFGSAYNLTAGPQRQGRKDYTVAYTCPEYITGAQPFVSPAADVWALGVVMYILLTGMHPFDNSSTSSEDEVMQSVVTVDPDFAGPSWDRVSAASKALCMRALSKNPAQRPTAAEMLADPWVRSRSSSAATATL